MGPPLTLLEAINMPLRDFRSIILITLVVAACGGSGLQFWLYPEPRLPEGEDAVFAAYESNRLLLLDGEDVATTCWGDRRMAQQAYRRNDRVCRLHMVPGRHTAVFETGLQSRQRATLDFDALPGRVYGLNRSGCTVSTQGIQQNCRFEIVELGGPDEG